MIELKKFFTQLLDYRSYMIPVLLYAAASSLHAAVHWKIYIIVFLQIIFFIWAAVIAYNRKLVLWPAAVFGILLLLFNSGSMLYSEYSLHRVTGAIAADDTIRARDLLESVDSDETVKSKLYLHLQELVSIRIEQQTADLVAKAKGELKVNNLDEAKRTVALIFDYDSDNKSAVEISQIITGREIAVIEKQLSPEVFAGLKTLRKNVDLLITKKKFDEAEKSIDDFLNTNPGIDKSSLIISPLADLVEEREKGAELAKQKQLNYKRIDDALSLYRKKKYGESVKLLEEVLNYDRKNSTAKRLLQKAEAKLHKERTAMWKNIAIISAILAAIGFFIWRRR